MERNEPIAKQALSLYRRDLSKILPWSFNLLLIYAICFFVSMFVEGTSLFLVPLFAIPFTFAFQMTNSTVKNNDVMRPGVFNSFYRGYFSREFLGVYRITISAICSFLFGFTAYMVVTLVYSNVVDPTFNNAIQSLSDALKSNDFDTYDALLLEEPIYSFMMYSITSFIGVFYIFFIHFLARNAVIAELKLRIYAPIGTIRHIFGYGAKHQAKGFNKEYYLNTFFILLILAGGFALGATITYFIISSPDIHESLTTGKFSFMDIFSLIGLGGVFFASILMIIILPYFYNVIYLLVEKYKKGFASTTLEIAQASLEQIKNTRRLTDEEEREVEKAIKETEDALKQIIDEEPKEEKEEEKDPDHHDPSEYE